MDRTRDYHTSEVSQKEKDKYHMISLCNPFVTPCDPMDYTVYGILQVGILWVAIPGDLSNPGIESRSPTLQADCLPAKPQGKSKNIGVGSLSLLQRIFLTQQSNQGLLHCRRILDQLSYQGSHRDYHTSEVSQKEKDKYHMISLICRN